jgi:hypothetical protein
MSSESEVDSSDLSDASIDSYRAKRQQRAIRTHLRHQQRQHVLLPDRVVATHPLTFLPALQFSQQDLMPAGVPRHAPGVFLLGINCNLACRSYIVLPVPSLPVPLTAAPL